MRSSLATRSAVGGWVENSRPRPVPLNGLAIIRWEAEVETAVLRERQPAGAHLDLAQGGGERERVARQPGPGLVRLVLPGCGRSAIWIMPAATGPSSIMSSAPRNPGPSSSSEPPKNTAT